MSEPDAQRMMEDALVAYAAQHEAVLRVEPGVPVQLNFSAYVPAIRTAGPHKGERTSMPLFILLVGCGVSSEGRLERREP